MGIGPIYQLARVFRDDELGRFHNPEFTLLEWYQLDIDHMTLIDEVDVFLQEIFHFPPLIKKSYQAIFEELIGMDPFTASIDDFKRVLTYFNLHDILEEQEEDKDSYYF